MHDVISFKMLGKKEKKERKEGGRKEKKRTKLV